MVRQLVDDVVAIRQIIGAARALIGAADGAAMLIYQGAKSFEIWTGLPAPIDAMNVSESGCTG